MGPAEALGGPIHDGFEHPLRIVLELVVPDAQHPPAFLLEESVALAVTQGVGMLATIEFDNQPRLPAGEVGEVGADRELTGELRPEAGNDPPQLALVLRGTIAKGACPLGLSNWNPAAHAPSIARRASRTHP